MCNRVIKDISNVYYLARLKASKCNNNYNSREGASEDLNISSAMLGKYERGECNVPSDILLNMVEVYQAPELVNYYCTHNCLIGKTHRNQVEFKDIAIIALQITNKLEDINIHKRKLVEVAADGIIDESEVEVIQEIVDYFGKMKQTISELELWITKNNIEKNIKKSPNK